MGGRVRKKARGRSEHEVGGGFQFAADAVAQRLPGAAVLAPDLFGPQPSWLEPLAIVGTVEATVGVGASRQDLESHSIAGANGHPAGA